MNRGFLIIALFAAIGIGMYYYLQPQSGGMQSGDSRDVMIQNGRMEPPVIRVSEDATVTIEFRADEVGTVTVENYNISVTTALGRAVRMTIPASRAGSFPIVMYPALSPRERIPVGTLEVEALRRGW